MKTTVIVILSVLVLVIILLGVALYFIKPGRKRDTSYFEKKLYAHRGLHDGVVPENSLTAFRLASEQGYGAELDVQMTKDGVLVVFHDDTLDRMCGVTGSVKDYTFDELEEFRLKGTDEKIPLFKDVLDALNGADLICELKSTNGVKNYTLCEKTYDMLMTYKGRFCIESFSPQLVRWFYLNHPEVIRGQLSCDLMKDESISPIARFMLTHLLVNFLSKPDFIAYCYKDTKKLGFKLCKKLYAPFTAAWTPKGDDAIDEARGSFDSIIFEKLG